MMTPSVEQAILEELNRLNAEQQHEVLMFARGLAPAPHRGVPGRILMSFAGSIDTGDLVQMEEAINEGCEQVNTNEW